MLRGHCHCGAVRIEVPAPPATGNRCLCSVCRRYGVVWGYFAAADVGFDGHPAHTEFYARRPDGLRFVRCRTCGDVTHWEAAAAGDRDRYGINLNLFDPDVLGGVAVRESDGPL